MKSTRLLLLTLLFLLLFTEPMMSVVNREATVAGIPALYAYVFAVWAIMIGLLAYVIHRSHPADESISDE